MEVEVEYNNLFEYVSYSQDQNDFVDRFAVVVSVVISELSVRLENSIFPFTAMKKIDELQREVESLIANVNSVKIIDNQPYVSDSFLLLMLQFNHPILYRDYVLAKYVLKN